MNLLLASDSLTYDCLVENPCHRIYRSTATGKQRPQSGIGNGGITGDPIPCGY